MIFLRRPRLVRDFLSIAVIGLALGACGSTATDSAALDPETARTFNVVVLFDRSGSTQENGSRIGIERAIWPATFFPNLGRSYTLNVMPIGFAANADPWCEWPSSEQDLIGGERNLSQDLGCKSKISNLIKGTVDTRGTYFNRALDAADEQLAKARGQKFVLLVTDGEYAQTGIGNIKCSEDSSSEACRELGNSLDRLNAGHITVCSIFVSTPSSEAKSSQTLEWLRDRQNENDSKSDSWDQAGCPASTEIDLGKQPWQLAEDIIVWYSEELVGLRTVSTTANSDGYTQTAIRVPNGAAQIALLGLKSSSGSSIGFSSPECELGESVTFDSFLFQSVRSELVNGERCPASTIEGTGLAPNQNSLIALFVPERQELAACIPDSAGGGELQFQSGFKGLLEYKPRLYWVGPRGEVVDANVKPEQFSDAGIVLTEAQATDLQSREGWGIAFEYGDSLNQPSKQAPYSLLYESTVLREGNATSFAARRPISPTISGEPCVKLFERSLWQKYWVLFIAIAAITALLITRTLIAQSRVNLAGELQILDGSGTRVISTHEVSGGSPSWFNIGEKFQIESGKSKSANNWRLVWRKGSNVHLLPESRSTDEDWSIGTPKRDRGRNAIEFRRVPLSGGQEVNTVRYFPEGGKVDEAIEEALEEEVD